MAPEPSPEVAVLLNLETALPEQIINRQLSFRRIGAEGSELDPAKKGAAQHSVLTEPPASRRETPGYLVHGQRRCRRLRVFPEVAEDQKSRFAYARSEKRRHVFEVVVLHAD